MIRAMINDRKGYKVFSDNAYDSVYIPSEINNKIIENKIYESLNLLMKDLYLLRKKNNFDIHFLYSYINNYINFVFIASKSKKIYNPLHILFTAFQYRIINFYQFLISIISYFCYFYVGKYSKFLTKAHFWIVYKLINP
jgi:hypothetical protein